MRNEDDVGGRARVTRDKRSECCEEEVSLTVSMTNPRDVLHHGEHAANIEGGRSV